MKMTRTFIIYCLISLLAVGTASATDTTQTPTPAQIITTPAATLGTDIEAVIQNSAVNAKMIRLNPRAVSFVTDYTTKNRKHLMSIKDKGMPFFKLIDDIFTQHEIPTELKYLSVIESQLKTSAVSHMGAAGPWQFMPSTAKTYGLKITKYKDERCDYTKSTHAAARYLKYLYNEFGDWLLVIAAYNSGPGYVYNAIKKSKSRNFWDLQYYLPEESRNHVKKFISAHYIYEGNGGICTLTKAEAIDQIGSLVGYLLNRNLTAEELREATTTTISGKYRAAIIAKYINMDVEDFNRYNPQFDKLIDTEADGYEMKLPEEAMEKFVANKYPILNESVQSVLNGTETAADLPKKEQMTAIK
jgi:membrane-bound lytic murein transglycosylase D